MSRRDRSEELIKKHTPKTKPWILTKPDTPLDAARRAGYNSVEEMLETRKIHLRQKKEKRLRVELQVKREKEARVTALAKAKAELMKCLAFQSGHGNRVRATIRDRVAGKKVVAINNENTRRIALLKKQIAQLEPVLK